MRSSSRLDTERADGVILAQALLAHDAQDIAHERVGVADHGGAVAADVVDREVDRPGDRHEAVAAEWVTNCDVFVRRGKFG